MIIIILRFVDSINDNILFSYFEFKVKNSFVFFLSDNNFEKIFEGNSFIKKHPPLYDDFVKFNLSLIHIFIDVS